MGAWIETDTTAFFVTLTYVAPYVGAWIETPTLQGIELKFKSHPTWVRGLKHELYGITIRHIIVAPYVGAWIETSEHVRQGLQVYVAPYVGAWIETQCKDSNNICNLSHPTWVRGLKLPGCNQIQRRNSRTLRGCVD